MSATGRLLVILAAVAAGAVSSVDAAPLDEAVEQYRPFVIRNIDQALAGARDLHDRIVAHDVTGARIAWVKARIGWERSEVFTSGFVPELDKAIDAWPDAATGFHAIEARLFSADPSNLDEQSDALIHHLVDLDVQIHDMKLTSEGLLNGIVRLAYEVGDSKIDGGESRFSGTSLDDMRNNVDGIQLAYETIFAPAVAARDPKMDEKIRSEIGQLKVLLSARDLRAVDADNLRKASETLIVALQTAGPMIGLGTPTLEETSK
jgi:iron uptake system component EfeO